MLLISKFRRCTCQLHVSYQTWCELPYGRVWIGDRASPSTPVCPPSVPLLALTFALFSDCTRREPCVVHTSFLSEDEMPQYGSSAGSMMQGKNEEILKQRDDLPC